LKVKNNACKTLSGYQRKLQGKYPLARITMKLKDFFFKEKDLYVCIILKTKDV